MGDDITSKFVHRITALMICLILATLPTAVSVKHSWEIGLSNGLNQLSDKYHPFESSTNTFYRYRRVPFMEDWICSWRRSAGKRSIQKSCESATGDEPTFTL